MQNSLKKSRFIVFSLAELLLFLSLWQLLAMTDWFPTYISSPAVVFGIIGEMFMTGEVFPHIGVSLYRSIIGFLLVVLFGTGLGILAGFFQPIGRFFDPVVSFFNPIPKIALLPVFLVWFGVTDTTRILIIFTSAFFPCFIATLDGVRGINKLYLWSAENMGASRFKMLYRVILPASLPKIFDGWRVALALTFVMMFSSEMIGSSTGKGLGFMILNADAYGRTDIVLAAVTVIAALGFLFDRLLIALRQRVLWWQNR
ncbi:ABC transporter permease [Sporosarcina pasteurii]|uniref:Aliphatic sulfonates transport permease protein ssuC n=1 Tax=Sporosarcina pasteurii TaxID=1474 RepID=A0A380C4M2_SPOPA|nr:ABC transporter permease [Sporosarcina pasteurii]MDS9471627.1 ABC transporter permease [Sporosarcina pasteurii]QBQ04763.1 ABC transporter permease [Sporosarcina pasteurii]SUJ11467.1 Putative aliphatic sulfonates transport permease protein ssuC [Sporosarcina pasteurii]